MVKSLPDAGLCFGSCLVVLVNSLLEVVNVLEAEKKVKMKSKSLIKVLTEVEVRSCRGQSCSQWDAIPQECVRTP